MWAQMRMELEKRNKLGHWASQRSMPEGYDRSTCSAEPQLRGDIINAIRGGRAPATSFEVPKPVPTIEQDNANRETCDYRNVYNSGRKGIVDIAQLIDENMAGSGTELYRTTISRLTGRGVSDSKVTNRPRA